MTAHRHSGSEHRVVDAVAAALDDIHALSRELGRGSTRTARRVLTDAHLRATQARKKARHS